MTRPLTVQDILDGYDNPAWLGFGYLGERRRAMDATDPEVTPIHPDLIAAADALVLMVANRAEWTPERLFEWANSKRGRWFSDVVLHGGGAVDLAQATALVA